MTITATHLDRARAAVTAATKDVPWNTMTTINSWLHKNSAFATLVELVATSIGHGYCPTIRPVTNSAKAQREADLVATAFDAACSWAFPPETPMRAYRGDVATFRFNRGNGTV